MATTIGIMVFDGAEELDWVGPLEVLGGWGELYPNDEVEVIRVSVGDTQVRCIHGTTVVADHTLESAPPLDVIVYPGGMGTRAHLGDERIRDWLRGHSEHGALMTSVCTGALVYADAGLLDGRPATTHWGALDLLESLGRGIDVRRTDRFVDDGDVITAAGVSAGIDMALHLVARLSSVETAQTVRRYIQYDPAPPV